VTAADSMCSVVPAGAELRHVEFFGGSTAGAPTLASCAPHTRPNFRVAVLLKYRSNAHDVVEGTYADDPGRPDWFAQKASGRSLRFAPHTGPGIRYIICRPSQHSTVPREQTRAQQTTDNRK